MNVIFDICTLPAGRSSSTQRVWTLTPSSQLSVHADFGPLIRELYAAQLRVDTRMRSAVITMGRQARIHWKQPAVASDLDTFAEPSPGRC